MGFSERLKVAKEKLKGTGYEIVQPPQEVPLGWNGERGFLKIWACKNVHRIPEVIKKRTHEKKLKARAFKQEARFLKRRSILASFADSPSAHIKYILDQAGKNLNHAENNNDVL